MLLYLLQVPADQILFTAKLRAVKPARSIVVSLNIGKYIDSTILDNFMLTSARRHMVKHTRPFQCQFQSCHVRPFGDRAGLLRHTREVHKLDSRGGPTRKYNCPEPSCTRHTKGFGRQWNMAQHFRRAHTDGSELAARQVRSSSPETSDAVDSIGVITNALDTSEKSSGVCESLRSKLARLQQEKDRVVAEMVAVQKVIEVFDRPES